jgi:mannose-1-phosphate guanylyltransferase
MATEAPDSLQITLVLDDEHLFRSVEDHVNLHACDTNGKLRQLSHSAFNDRYHRPSVDRALMRTGGAQASRLKEDDGVVTVCTRDVRSIRHVVTSDSKGKPIQGHQVDVVHEPLANNAAHSVVSTAPKVESKGAWMKLKEALCQLAKARGWSYPPASAR